MEKTVVIIDGNSLINRAYYAMQRPMITKEGLYTQGVYGFINMLGKIRTDYEPGYIAVAFDRKAPTFRHIEYDEYKAGRKKMPPELAMQLPLLKEVLAAMNIKMLEIDGFEGDDIIGTVARRAEKDGLEPLIITGDRDALQLATDKCRVLITKKGISEFELYDAAAFTELHGFTPLQFIDCKGLMGDASDNIPGLPGVGEKTAHKLVQEYGSVENLIASVDSLPKGKLRENIEENAQLAMMSKRLATICTDVPIDFDIEELRVCEPHYDALVDAYTKLEFNSFMKKLNIKESAKLTEAANRMPETKVEIRCVNGDDGLDEMLKALETEGRAVLKVMTDGNHKATPEIYSISVMVNNVLYYASFGFERIVRALNGVRITGHGLTRDYHAIIANFPEVTSGRQKSYFTTEFDTAIAAYLIEPSRSNYELGTLALEYFHEELMPEEKFVEENGQQSFFSDNSKTYSEYAAKLAGYVRAIRGILEPKLEEFDLTQVFRAVELPLVEVLASMEAAGFAVDRTELTKRSADIEKRIAELSEAIYGLAGGEFNINSPKQLGTILFEKLGLTAGKKTKNGYSTNAETLESIADEHEIIPAILEYRMLSKLKSTYIDGLTQTIADDGRIHPHFQQTVTATGRISCTEPNLQNIPVRQELGRLIRKAFKGNLVSADYSQIELRVLAHMSGDENMIDAFRSGEDIHRSTASKVFNVPLSEVTKEERSAAKAVNFGVIYGMSSFGLSGEIHVSRKKAEAYIEEYFKRFPGVKSFMDGQVEFAKANGYTVTMLGRRRAIPEIRASQFTVRALGERLAMNSPIQGSAADIIKFAMISVYMRLREEGCASRLILQVHDELIIEAAEGEEERVTEILKECMENVLELAVELTVSVSRGNDWYELK